MMKAKEMNDTSSSTVCGDVDERRAFAGTEKYQ
jgi:hypothetical protein